MFKKIFTEGLDNYMKAHKESAYAFTDLDTRGL